MTPISPDLSNRMIPPLDDAERPFWTGGRDGQLLIQRCGTCGTWVHPPVRGAHEGCGGEVTATPVSGKGTVYSFTVNHHPFRPDLPLPYVIALVELAEQADLRLFTNLVNVDPGAVSVGMPVRVLFEDQGEAATPVFEPDA